MILSVIERQRIATPFIIIFFAGYGIHKTNKNAIIYCHNLYFFTPPTVLYLYSLASLRR